MFLTIYSITRVFFLKFKIINNTEAIELINKKKAIIIDTRSLDLFTQGHIVHSINFLLEHILLNKIETLKIYKYCPIILVISESNKYDECVSVFLKNGFSRIYVLKNGIDFWNLDNLPLVTKDK